MTKIDQVRADDPAHFANAGFEGIRVGRYKETRYWAVWVGDRLLAVTVYKKGAIAISKAVCLAGDGKDAPA